MRDKNVTNSAPNRTCSVIQPSSNPRFDILYDQIFRGAIEAAGLSPQRLEFNGVESSESCAFEAVAQQVRESAACFVDLTRQDPCVWFALGCAFALGKPLCLVAALDNTSTCATASLATILYPQISLPNDYRRLQKQITERLLSQTDDAEEGAESAQTTEGRIEPGVSEVGLHELLALGIVSRDRADTGMSLRNLAMEMNRHGVARATSVALNGLCRRRLVERRVISIVGEAGEHQEDRIFLTSAGNGWIEANQVDLSVELPQLEADPPGLMDLIHSL